MAEPGIADELWEAQRAARRRCAAQPAHDVCEACEEVEMLGAAIAEIASLNDKLVMQDIELQALRNRAESDKHLALTLSKQLDEAENEREAANKGWEATKVAANERVESLETKLRAAQVVIANTRNVHGPFITTTAAQTPGERHEWVDKEVAQHWMDRALKAEADLKDCDSALSQAEAAARAYQQDLREARAEARYR